MDKLFSIIETDSECCYSFTRVEMIGEEFKTKATCGECESELFVVSSLQRTKLSMQIREENKPHSFTKTRRLAKDRAKRLKADLVKRVHVRTCI